MVIYTYTIYRDYKSYLAKEYITYFSVMTGKEYNDRLKYLSKDVNFKDKSPSKYLFHVSFTKTDAEEDVPEYLHPLFEERIWKE